VTYEDILFYGGYCCFYDFISKILNKEVKGFNEYKNFIEHSGIFKICVEGFVFVSKPPTIIHRDNLNRLHAEKTAAIQFNDGWSLNFVHGVNFSDKEYKELVLNKPKPEDIVKVRNADQRTALIQLYGYDYVFEHLPGKKVLDTHKTIQKGTDKEVTYVLFEYEHGDNLVQRVVRVEWWENNSLKTAVIGVPVEVSTKTALGGIAWSFGMSEKEYVDSLEVEA
jgi:hypothetical protein